jgi:hypothetical protein
MKMEQFVSGFVGEKKRSPPRKTEKFFYLLNGMQTRTEAKDDGCVGGDLVRSLFR